MLLLVLPWLFQCVPAETVRRPVGRLGQAWLPVEYDDGVRYAGPKGDTILLKEQSRDTTYVASSSAGGPDVEVFSQRLNILLACDTPYTRIRYTLTAAAEEPLRADAQDELQVDYQSKDETRSLRLAMKPTAECLSPGCTLQDSLLLRSVTADSVYRARTDKSLSVLYLNKRLKVVGFRTPASHLYERIN